MTIPVSWLNIDYKSAIKKISTNKIKIKQSEYLNQGNFPIIDQGQNYIGGYTNDNEKIINCNFPIIVFGDHTKVVKLIDFKFAPGADGVKLVRPLSFFNPKIFFYFTKYLAKKIPDKGYSRHFQYIEKEKIPLPPINEQNRIVEKIEELLSDLDKANEELKKTQEQLKIYRQAVLKVAFEGKLTNHEKHINKSIKRFGMHIKIVSGNTPKGINNIRITGEVPFFKISDMNTIGNEIYMKKANIMLTGKNVNEMKIKIYPKGTVIFPKRGGAILTNKKRILFQDSSFDLNTMGVIPNDKIISKYLYFWFLKLNLGTIYDGSSVPQINNKNIVHLRIPMPEIEIQNEIVKEIESRLSVCDKLEETVLQSLEKIEYLRHSILKKAFEGNLVPQNPEDEPVEKLLERIKQEKEKFELNKKKRK